MTILFIIGGIFLTIITVLLITMFNIKFDDDNSACINSWHYRLFNTLRWEDPSEFPIEPKTVCSYFWSFVIYIISLPFTFFPVLLGLISKKLRFGSSAIYVASFLTYVIIIISIVVGEWFKVYNITDNFYALSLLGFLSIIIVFSILVVIILLILNIEELISKKRYKSTKNESIIRLKFKSWKERNCPIIKWND